MLLLLALQAAARSARIYVGVWVWAAGMNGYIYSMHLK